MTFRRKTRQLNGNLPNADSPLRCAIEFRCYVGLPAIIVKLQQVSLGKLQLNLQYPYFYCENSNKITKFDNIPIMPTT